MNPQLLIHHQGHQYLIETVTAYKVTEITNDEGGRWVGGAEADEVMDVAHEARRATPWPTNGLTEVLTARFEMALHLQADQFVRAAIAMAVHELATDGELHEWLDRIGIDTEGEVAA